MSLYLIEMYRLSSYFAIVLDGVYTHLANVTILLFTDYLPFWIDDPFGMIQLSPLLFEEPQPF